MNLRLDFGGTLSSCHIQEGDLQSYFLARDHFYICDKFVHGPTEKDEVYLHGYVSRLVRDIWLSRFLKRVPKKQVKC